MARTLERRNCFTATLALRLTLGALAAWAEVSPTEDMLAAARELNASGRQDEAEAMARRLVAAAETDHGPDSPEAVEAQGVLLDVLLSGRHAASEETRALAERMLAARRASTEADDARIAESLTHLARAHHAAGNAALARPLLEEALALRRRTLGEGHADVAASLDALGAVLKSMGDFATARGVLEEALGIRRAALGATDVAVAETLDRLGGVVSSAGAPADARPLFEEALAIRAAALGADHPSSVPSLLGLADVAMAGTDLPGARALTERALAIRRGALPPDHPDIAETCVLLATVAHAMGDAPTARKSLDEALGIQRSALGAEHPNVAKTLNQLGLVLDAAGDHVAARTALEEALAIRRKALGPEHPLVAQSLNGLGNALHAVGDYAAARRAYDEALGINRKAFGPNHRDVGASLHNISRLLDTMGDVTGARRLAEQALAVLEKALGAEHRDVATSLHGVARLDRLAGEFEAARQRFERVIAIRRASLGPDHPHVAAAMAELATLLQAAGDHAAAREAFEDAIAIARAALGPDHPQVLSMVTGMGLLLDAMGDRPAARSLLEDAIARLRKGAGADPVNLAMQLDTLGNVMQAMGDLDGARALYEEAHATYVERLGPVHRNVAGSLHNLATNDAARGDLASARRHEEEALAILRKVRGPAHPDLARMLGRLAHVLAQSGQLDDAVARAVEAEAISRDHLRLTAATLSQREALRYARTRAGGLGIGIACMATRPDPPLVASVLDQLVRSRGLTLDVLAERSRAASVDPALAPLVLERTMAATRLSRLTARGPGRDTPERHAELLELERKALEQAERELGRQAAAFLGRTRRAGIGLSEVAAALAPSEALVSYVRYNRIASPPATGGAAQPDVPEPAYAAFVVRGGDARPALVPLGPAEPLERAVARWRNAVAEPEAGADRARSTGERVRELAWDPMAGLLAGARRVVVVPDGALLSVPLAALPLADGRYLVESDVTLAHVSAERDVVRDEAAVTPPAELGLLALGSADFEATTAPSALEVATVATATPNVALRGGASACPTFATLKVAPLPATRGEALDVARAWRADARRRRPAERATVLTGSRATEGAFKAEAGRHGVLHVATHGFFLGEDCAPAAAAPGTAPGAGSGASPALALENPLLRSGLALAGFNARHAAPNEAEDGVLTAEEVASLDLSSVELAVLSACETGLGDVQSGEGVLGLQRAFRIAGARTLVMSMWKVPDAETRVFMRELYDARLRRGRDAASCVRDASLAVLEDRRVRGLDDSPFWWGAFVASGDVR